VRLSCALLVLFAAACGSSNKVGAGIDVNKLNAKADRLGQLNLPKDKGKGGFVGGTNANTQPGSTNTQAQASAQAAAQAKAAKQQQIASAVAFSITGSGYNPYYIRVYKGGSMKATNADAQARTVTADRGEFDSGKIQPGGEWIFQANTVGKFNFHDDTRPYVVGTLEVLSR
jgi:plastocyanin